MSTGLAPRALKKDASRNYASHPPSWSTAPPSSASHLVLELFKKEGVILERIRTGKRSVHSFGRNSDICTHTLDHGSISRQHALIVHTATGPYLVDLHSSQGTTVNERKVEAGEPIPLYDEDVIAFGASGRKYKVKGSGRSRGGDGSATEEKSHSAPSSESREKRPRDEEGTSSSNRPKRSFSPSSSVPSHKVAASHILLKHTQSRRPSSHRSAVITRTPDEARALISDLRTQLLPHLEQPLTALLPVFAKMADEHSDCSSYKRGGALGRFGYEQMQKKFSEVAFGLKVGEVSGPVETESGVHLILRTE